MNAMLTVLETTGSVPRVRVDLATDNHSITKLLDDLFGQRQTEHVKIGANLYVVYAADATTELFHLAIPVETGLGFETIKGAAAFVHVDDDGYYGLTEQEIRAFSGAFASVTGNLQDAFAANEMSTTIPVLLVGRLQAAMRASMT